ncbi:MAG: SCO family protein [Proteobacteria bacterium]|nr:SCO family protein [Pseudomonadota bacterium]MDA1355640.1 SCO family protein [Pseudomonadota bacterium]
MNFLRPKTPRHDNDPGNSRDPRGLRRNPLVWIAVLGAIVLYTQMDGSLLGNLDEAQRADVHLTNVGGPFTLTDHNGRTVTEQDYRGRNMLIYFGYAWCPDVCPTKLLVMGQAMDLLGDVGQQVQPIFITVDPARDTVETLAKYVENFHPRLTGLTGSDAQIATVADAYKVYFSKGDELDGADDYVVDHTDIMYFMGPDGALLEYFQTGQRPVDIAQAIGQHL